MMRRYTIEIDGASYVVDVREEGADRFRVRVDGSEFDVRLSDGEALPEVTIAPLAGPPRLPLPPAEPAAATNGSRTTRPPRQGAPPIAADSHTAVTAPLPGVVESILVSPGDVVAQAQPLLVLEAMKMRNTIHAARPGVVGEILAQQGQTVRHGDVLLYIDREEP